MKKIHPHLKKIALLHIFIMTLQSCSVYYSKTATMDQALQSNNKVKIITTTNDIYKFEKLQMQEDQIYGVLKQGSTKAENLMDQGLLEDYDGKYGKLLLSQDTIQAIHLKNKKASKAVNIVVPTVAALGILVGIGAYTASNASYGW